MQLWLHHSATQYQYAVVSTSLQPSAPKHGELLDFCDTSRRAIQIARGCFHWAPVARDTVGTWHYLSSIAWLWSTDTSTLGRHGDSWWLATGSDARDIVPVTQAEAQVWAHINGYAAQAEAEEVQ